MPMTQTDIRQYYEKEWQTRSDHAAAESDFYDSSRVEDAVLYPVYRELIENLGLRVDGGRVLDVGCGAGRWIRFFRDNFEPRLLMGIDCTESSIALQKKWSARAGATQMEFRVADITSPELDIAHSFTLINIANVLFHIPEHELFMHALRNLAKLVAPAGRIVTTEYLPRITMRTNWMLVRSRYEFEAAVRSVGLRIVEIRATTFFANDPMGLDGPDDGPRQYFHRVRQFQQTLLKDNLNPSTRDALVAYMTDIERATLAFARERLADIDMPSQKLVVLGPATQGA